MRRFDMSHSESVWVGEGTGRRMQDEKDLRLGSEGESIMRRRQEGPGWPWRLFLYPSALAMKECHAAASHAWLQPRSL